MRTGIEFFDEREFQPGDLVVITGFTGSGKSILSTAVAHGLAEHGDNDDAVLHVDLENTREAWERRVKPYGKKPYGLTYRSMTAGAFTPSEFGHAAVVLDHIGLLSDREGIHEFARVAKLYAVRQKTVVVIVAQLKRELGIQLDTEGWVDPAWLPEWMLEFGDQIYMLSRSDENFRVVEARGEGGRLNGSPRWNGLDGRVTRAATFVRDAHGRFVQDF